MKIYSPTQYKKGKHRGASRKSNLRILPFRLTLFVRRGIESIGDYVEDYPLGFYWAVIGTMFITMMMGYSISEFIAV